MPPSGAARDHDAPQDAQGLAHDPARAGRRGRPARPGRRHEGRRLRGPPQGHPRSGTGRHDRHRSASPACAAAAVPGFPTGQKWRLAATTEAPRRYVVANGYGADPASGTDRALLTLDPFAIVEGVAIAALAIGATEAFIAVRSEDTRRHRRPRGRRSPPPRMRASSGRMSRASATTSWSASGPSRAPTCWARRRSCSRPSRASAASQSSGRRIPPSAACTACRPSSTTSRPSRRSAGSCATAPPPSRRPGPPTAPARSSSRSGRPAAKASPRSRSAPRCATSSTSAGRCRTAGP